jgi:ATP-binding cassette subfamily C protein LapB
MTSKETPAMELLADPVLAKALSRLAALLGKAVPAHRFGAVAEVDGLELHRLPRDERAVKIWSALFPGATGAQRIAVPTVADYPLLWMGKSADASPLVVRGAVSSGGWVVDAPEGELNSLTPDQANGGQFISLRFGDQAEAEREGSEALPTTAKGWFLRTIYRRRRVFLEATLATVFVNVIGLATSFFTMNVYDRVIPTSSVSTLWVLTLGVLLGVVFEFVMKQTRASMVDRAFKSIDTELSDVFFRKALSIRMDVRPRTVGTFASQIRQFEVVRSAMTSTALFVAADAPFALVFIAVIWALAGQVALVPLLLLPCAIALGLAFRPTINRLSFTNLVESNQKNGLLIEAIDGIESIKSVQGEWKLSARWHQLSEKMAENELALRRITALSGNLTQFIQQIAYVGIIAFGALAIADGKLSTGGLIACSIISGRALAPMAQIASMIVQWAQAAAALKGLEGIMALPSDQMPGERPIIPESTSGELSIDQVKFTYQPNAPAVLEVGTLKIAPGERVAILGSVGSGKSTLVKILSGLYRPQAGRVFLGGLDVAQIAPEFVREQVGYLAQDVRLFQGTLRDNITIGLPNPSDEQLLGAARLTGLLASIEAHPKGLNLEISEGGRGLSGGQRQLVGLTRMLIAQPRVLLLDEPTASMDVALENFVIDRLFQALPKETTIVVVTHKTALLRHVTRLIVMERGRVVLDGPRDQVLARLSAPAAASQQGAQ